MKRLDVYNATAVVVRKYEQGEGHWSLVLASSSSEVSPLYLPFESKGHLHNFLFALPGVHEQEQTSNIGNMQVAVVREHALGYVIRVPGCIVFVNPNLVMAALRLVGQLDEG